MGRNSTVYFGAKEAVSCMESENFEIERGSLWVGAFMEYISFAAVTQIS
ncbi:hypothetical protein DsansV1_C29g0213871 [Dioscorea sansibarensis]